MTFFSFKQDTATLDFKIVCTQDIEGAIVESMSEMFHIEMMQAERTVEDVYSDGGDLFEDVVVYKTKIAVDKAEILFERFKEYMRKGISKSIGHTDN